MYVIINNKEHNFKYNEILFKCNLYMYNTRMKMNTYDSRIAPKGKIAEFMYYDTINNVH